MKVTVVTPTYNRGYILNQLFNSLIHQSCKDFEWLIIDDDSEDDTKSIVERWKNETKDFEIRYYKVKHGGKHRAINKAVDVARGELFFIVDSDDYILNNTIERIIYWANTIRKEDGFGGVCGNRGANDKDIIGTTFIGEYLDITTLERERYRIRGDKAEVFYTDILRGYKFPEIDGEMFMTENIVWSKIAHDGYKLRFFNEICIITEYREDGLTAHASQLAINNPIGQKMYYNQYLYYMSCYYSFEKNKLMFELNRLLKNNELEKLKELIQANEDYFGNDNDFVIFKQYIT